MSAKASGADTGANGDARHRHHDGSAGRSYTPEQKAAVLRIKRCQATAYYEILGLEEVRTTCSEGEIKKAYRKLSLLTHPDKNGYDGADDAFKMVARAFQVLSDPDKKSKFDQFGGDPDARFGGGGGTSAYESFARARGAAGGGGRGPFFEEEISPEELFRQFFGGGMGPAGFGGPFGGGLFDTGPGFVFNLGGGPGIRVTQFGGGRPRQRPRNAAQGQQETPSASSAISSLLPLLILVLFPILSNFFFSATTPRTPTLRFDYPNVPHTQEHISNRLKVPYWVNPVEVEDYGKKQWKELDRTAEHQYIQILHRGCELEVQTQRRMLDEAQGWFSRDEKKIKEAKNMELRSCNKLEKLGVYR